MLFFENIRILTKCMILLYIFHQIYFSSDSGKSGYLWESFEKYFLIVERILGRNVAEFYTILHLMLKIILWGGWQVFKTVLSSSTLKLQWDLRYNKKMAAAVFRLASMKPGVFLKLGEFVVGLRYANSLWESVCCRLF